MSDELDLETRLELTIIGLNAIKLKLEELDKQLDEVERLVEGWKL